MAEAVGSKLRMQLRSAVRSAWNTDEGFELQERLKRIARSKIEKEYERCAREVPGSEFRSCLRKAAEDAGIALDYRKLWGTA